MMDAMTDPQRPGCCPATMRHTPLHTVISVGVQCKYQRGHEGDHAGYGGFAEGDVFWPQESTEGTAPSPCYGA